VSPALIAKTHSLVVSIVVGTIALIRPFHVPRHTFIRDILFFTTAVVVLIAVLHDGHLTVAESGGMVVLYISYVGVVVAGNWWSRHRQDKEASRVLSREREHRPSLPELSFPEPTVRSPDSELLPLPNISTSQLSLTASPQPQLARARSHTTSSRLSPRMEAASPFLDTPRANFSLLGAIEFRDVVNSLRRESESRISSPSRTPLSPVPERDDYFGVVKIAHRRSISHQGAEILRGEPRRERRAVSHIPRTRPEAGPSPARPHPSSLEDPTSATPKPNVSSSPDLNPWKDQPGRPDRPRIIIPAESHAPSRIPSISVTDPTGAAAPPPVSSPWIAPQLEESRFQLRRRSRLILRVIFPSLQSFRHKSYVGMTLAVLSVPAILALTLTLPVVDEGQGDEGAVALPMTDDEPLNEGADQVSGIVPDADEDRLLRADVGEELHHLVDSGFSPLHSPLGRINYATLHHVEEDGIDGESISKELLEEIREEEALGFHKSLTAVQCVLGPMFCALVIFRKSRHLKRRADLLRRYELLSLDPSGRGSRWRHLRCDGLAYRNGRDVTNVEARTMLCGVHM